LLGVFHAAFVLLVLGHLELITEIGILQVVAHQVFLGRGLVGIALLVTILFFFFRRFHSPVREVSAPSDYYILILLFLTVLFGSELHLARQLFDYSTISVEEYREYLSGIFTFRPALPEMFREEDVGHAFLLVLHVFFANLLLMCFPASKMAHSLLAFPLARLKRR
jgi:nitrate reductase gamma subunit